MNNKVFLGFDTSNYTTSIAIVDSSGEIIANLKRPLTVKSGERGLRQSDAVFSHIKNLPELLLEAEEHLKDKTVLAVGVSSRPRAVEGSYMPCFLSGLAAAKSFSAGANAPIYEFSHQCGHLMSGIFTSGADELLSGEPFCAFHVSGGTTEMLRVKSSGLGFSCELVGETADLNAGQAIDRVGVKLGFSFPAGRELEAAALMNREKIPRAKPKINDYKINLSGLENLADSLYSKSGSRELVSAFVLEYVKDAIILLADSYIQRFGNTKFLFAGGVMCNSLIRAALSERYDSYFATPETSSDSAVGIAALTRRAYFEKSK